MQKTGRFRRLPCRVNLGAGPMRLLKHCLRTSPASTGEFGVLA